VQEINKSIKHSNNNIIIIKTNYIIAMKFQNQLFSVAQKNYNKIQQKKKVCNPQIQTEYITTYIFLSVCVCVSVCDRSHILCRLRALSITRTPDVHHSATRKVRWYSYEICDVFWQYKYGRTVLPKPFVSPTNTSHHEGLRLSSVCARALSR